jgi:hypothetical protein
VADVTYDLHKLGWRAFQDLSAVIMQTVLGQTFHAFADSNDGGRDGAFHGSWRTDADPETLPSGEALAGATVTQCKFSAAPTGTLTPAALKDEVDKAASLHKRGLCDNYLLLTNRRVTGRTDQWLRETLATHGINQTLALDGTWISQQISLNPRLRRYVPRVYGLGDLGQILDDRRLEQARVLLSRLREDLVTFVPTAPYRAAADALANHHFVLLLGEPAAGKTTIAATLSVAALDEWGCGVRRVDSAAELVQAWNPNEPDQLFWVDDAFGAIRHDPALTDGWARRLDQIMTAVKGGARVILTSRDYIYKDARPHLKTYAYPLLDEAAVVVNVADLTPEEKRRLLYNHLKAGDQPAAVLRKWRPHLRAVADVEPFQPEVARRLGSRAFTSGVLLASRAELVDFMQRPTDFLRDLLRQLSPGDRAALAAVFLSGDGLAVPVQLDHRLQDAIHRMGASAAEVLPAFNRLEGTFLRLTEDASGDSVLGFRHPTIREAFAATVASDTNTVGILIDGLTDEELVRQVDCGGKQKGTLVRVPPSLYGKVAARVPVPVAGGFSVWSNPVAGFLVYRCSDAFLAVWAAAHKPELDQLADFGMQVAAHWQPKVLARLHRASALPEAVRADAVSRLAEYAQDYFDPGWLQDDLRNLFSETERQAELQRFRDQSLHRFAELVHESAEGYDDDVSPDHRYDLARTAIRLYRREFAHDRQAQAVLTEADADVDRAVREAEQTYLPPPSPSLTAAMPDQNHPASDRDEFDDLHAGH